MSIIIFGSTKSHIFVLRIFVTFIISFETGFSFLLPIDVGFPYLLLVLPILGTAWNQISVHEVSKCEEASVIQWMNRKEDKDPHSKQENIGTMCCDSKQINLENRCYDQNEVTYFSIVFLEAFENYFTSMNFMPDCFTR